MRFCGTGLKDVRLEWPVHRSWCYWYASDKTNPPLDYRQRPLKIKIKYGKYMCALKFKIERTIKLNCLESMSLESQIMMHK